jgi:hypothetical protein
MVMVVVTSVPPYLHRSVHSYVTMWVSCDSAVASTFFTMLHRSVLHRTIPRRSVLNPFFTLEDTYFAGNCPIQRDFSSLPLVSTESRDLPVSRGEGPTLHFPANELDSQLCLPGVLFEISRDLRDHRWTTAFCPFHVTSQCHVARDRRCNTQLTR